MINNLTKLDATALIELLKSKKVTIAEVVNAYLDVIIHKDTDICAWEYIDRAVIEKQIKKIEKLNPSDYPLWGLPIGIKDIYNTFDMPTQMGSPIWKVLS